jgi:hypothetical protein
LLAIGTKIEWYEKEWEKSPHMENLKDQFKKFSYVDIACSKEN